MSAPKPRLVENGDAEFSRMEASFAHTKVEPRKNSIEMKDIGRHTQPSDLTANELDFNFLLDRDHYTLKTLRSLQDVFSVVQHDTHFSNPRNFSDATRVRCFEVNANGTTWHDLDSHRLSQFLESITELTQNLPRPASTDPSSRRLLAFFVPLVPLLGTSFGSQVALTQHSAMELFTALEVNPLFILNLLGRPDYWAPQTRWESDHDSHFVACDFFCQHPRWNLQFQGAPLSVYMRYSAASNLTTYIVSHKADDANVTALHNILNVAVDNMSSDQKASIFLDDPLDIAAIFSTLSLEASKHHVARFRRFMFTQVNGVDDHLAGLETNDRRKLSESTKNLQVLSQNADSHLANADVAIVTAKAIRIVHARLHAVISSRSPAYERVAQSINYVIDSIEKQKMWFSNYKNRKDSTMQLVYNLVTQKDAASNIQLAASMKQDSTSMNGIAALTMAFLPGTFIATVLSAGMFSATDNSLSIRVSGLWWLWVALTVPLTIAVIASWWLYKRRSNTVGSGPETIGQEDNYDGTPAKRRPFHFNSLRPWSQVGNTGSKA